MANRRRQPIKFMVFSPETTQPKPSPEYEFAFKDAQTESPEQIDQHVQALRLRIAEAEQNIAEKEQALGETPDGHQREILLAEIKINQMSIAKEQDFIRGYTDGLEKREQNESNEKNSNQVERKFIKVELEIIDPRGDKGFAITYDCPDRKFCLLYNMAIKNILEKENMRPFLQGGDWAASGWHMWEVWQYTDHAQMESFLEPIQKEAEVLFEKYKNQSYFWADEE